MIAYLLVALIALACLEGCYVILRNARRRAQHSAFVARVRSYTSEGR